MKKNNKLVILSLAILLGAVGCNPSNSGNRTQYDESKQIYEHLGYSSVDELEEAVLGDYDAKYRAAAAIVDPTKTVERYEAFAEAEYSLIYEEGIVIPWLTQSGYSASVSKTVPYQAGRASYGLTGDKLKNVVVTTKAITKEERAAVVAAWEAGKSVEHDPVVDGDGYTSLANNNLNGAVAGGQYSYGGKTFTVKNEYKTTYGTDPTKDIMNYLTNTWTYNSEHYTNFIDGLVENDKYGNIVGAIAESYKASVKDGKSVWTFKLRDDAKWVDPNTEAPVANVTAHDFVAGLKYVLNPAHGSGTASIPLSVIDGAPEYYASLSDEEAANDLGFDSVGVKAVSDYVLEFTLQRETPYFLSMLTYSPFLPVSQELLDTKGSTFGSTMFNIWCNGAFLPEVYEASAKIEYKKNPHYYDAAHVYVDRVVKTKSPDTATFSTGREWYEAGTIDAFSVNAQDTQGYAQYVTGPDGTGTIKNPYSSECNGILGVGDATYIGYFNFNRSTWEVNDPANEKDYSAKVSTAKALVNKNFRLGFLYGLNVLEYLKRYQPAEPHNWLMRGYTNRDLTSANNKDYADYVDEVFNRKQGTTGVTLTGINQGGDPIFNIEKARQYFETAKAELIAGGMKEADFPIKVDVIGSMSVEVQLYEQAMYASIAEAAEGIVEIQVNVPSSDDQNSSWGSIVNNYDFSVWSGWGPDYADPNTYLHTMAIGGDMVEQLGF